MVDLMSTALDLSGCNEGWRWLPDYRLGGGNGVVNCLKVGVDASIVFGPKSTKQLAVPPLPGDCYLSNLLHLHLLLRFLDE